MSADKILLAAQGYLELGMAGEALAELDDLPDVYRKRPDVLRLRVSVALHARRWQDGLAVPGGRGHQSCFQLRRDRRRLLTFRAPDRTLLRRTSRSRPVWRYREAGRV